MRRAAPPAGPTNPRARVSPAAAPRRAVPTWLSGELEELEVDTINASYQTPVSVFIHFCKFSFTTLARVSLQKIQVLCSGLSFCPLEEYFSDQALPKNQPPE